MNAAMVSSLMSMIPERVARVPSGSAFVPAATHGPKLAYLVPFLHWLSPLTRLTKDDQRALGVRAPLVPSGLRAVALEEEEKDLEFDPHATPAPSAEFEPDEEEVIDDLDEPQDEAEELDEAQLLDEQEEDEPAMAQGRGEARI